MNEMDEKDILKDLFLGLIRALSSLFRRRKKSYSIPIKVREIRDLIIEYSGAHKVILLQITNGKSSLQEASEMFITTIDKYVNELHVKRVPEFNNTKIDAHFRYVVMRIIEEGKVEIHLGNVEEGSMFHKRWLRSGVNMSEFYLIKKSEKEAIVLVMSTSDMETVELNPFDEKRDEIDKQINHLREYYKKQ